MKIIVLLAGLVSLCSSSAIPAVVEATQYVDSHNIWITDDQGNQHLADRNEVDDETILNNGADNQYWLYTRQNPTTPQTIIFNNPDSIRDSNYNPQRLLKVIVHGWSSDGSSDFSATTTSAFLAFADVNVIVVDWSQLANSEYTIAAAGVPSVGLSLGNFLGWLIKTAGGNWNDMHLVGFNLGAHVVGSAGKAAGGRPLRITGLDPTDPEWANNGDASNAGQYVEAVHTDGALQEIFDKVADNDFFPNTGRNPQPGCWISTTVLGNCSQPESGSTTWWAGCSSISASRRSCSLAETRLIWATEFLATREANSVVTITVSGQATGTATATATGTVTATATATATGTTTATATSLATAPTLATATTTSTAADTVTSTSTSTATDLATSTSTATATNTATATSLATSTYEATATSTATASNTPTAKSTATVTASTRNTATATATSTATAS